MREAHIVFVLVAIGTVLVPTAPVFGRATRRSDAIWADGQIWNTVVTPATFKAPRNLKSVDVLLVFDESGLAGQRPIAEAAPYQKSYNGGRWFVWLVVFTEAGKAAHDPDNDGNVNFELTSFEQAMVHYGLGHFEFILTDTYFVCPLVG